jgi:hypothetical protein
MIKAVAGEDPETIDCFVLLEKMKVKLHRCFWTGPNFQMKMSCTIEVKINPQP